MYVRVSDREAKISMNVKTVSIVCAFILSINLLGCGGSAEQTNSTSAGSEAASGETKKTTDVLAGETITIDNVDYKITGLEPVISPSNSISDMSFRTAMMLKISYTNNSDSPVIPDGLNYNTVQLYNLHGEAATQDNIGTEFDKYASLPTEKVLPGKEGTYWLPFTYLPAVGEYSFYIDTPSRKGYFKYTLKDLGKSETFVTSSDGVVSTPWPGEGAEIEYEGVDGAIHLVYEGGKWIEK